MITKDESLRFPNWRFWSGPPKQKLEANRPPKWLSNVSIGRTWMAIRDLLHLLLLMFSATFGEVTFWKAWVLSLLWIITHFWMIEASPKEVIKAWMAEICEKTI